VVGCAVVVGGERRCVSPTCSPSGGKPDVWSASGEFCGVARRGRFFSFRSFFPDEGASFSEDLTVSCQTRDDLVSATPQKSLVMRGAAAEETLFFSRIMRFLGREFCGLGARGAKDKIGSGRADEAFSPRDFTVFASQFCSSGGFLLERRITLRIADDLDGGAPLLGRWSRARSVGCQASSQSAQQVCELLPRERVGRAACWCPCGVTRWRRLGLKGPLRLIITYTFVHYKGEN
jgi:hypothetical protein